MAIFHAYLTSLDDCKTFLTAATDEDRMSAVHCAQQDPEMMSSIGWVYLGRVAVTLLDPAPAASLARDGAMREIDAQQTRVAAKAHEAVAKLSALRESLLALPAPGQPS